MQANNAVDPNQFIPYKQCNNGVNDMLPGTELIRKAFKRTGKGFTYRRIFTQVRANDRTYKVWGRYTEQQAQHLVNKLTKLGALNARKVMMSNPYNRNEKVCTGIRFEY